MFFFEKRNQKTFIHLHSTKPVRHAVNGEKVFLLLFLQKKKILPSS